MHKLYGVFDGEYVRVSFVIYVINHGGQGGGFPGASRPSQQTQASRLIGYLFEYGWAIELFQTHDLRWDVAKNSACTTVMIESIDAKTSEISNLKREIALQTLFVLLTLGVAHDVVNHGSNLRVI
jgi:hypothetical protein